MKQTIIVLTLCAVLFTLCSPAEAQHAGKTPRIGYLDSGSASDPQNMAFRDAFLQGLRDLGYGEVWSNFRENMAPV